MKNLIYKSLLLMTVATVLTACVEDPGPTSFISKFEDYTVTASSVTAFGEVDEEDATYTVKFLLPANQNITDITLLVSTSPTSTATEGVDFELSTHEISILALSSDSISVDVTILNDLPAEEDETIYLTLAGQYGDPRPIEVQVGTILANGEKFAPTIDFTLRWSLDDPTFAEVDVCDYVGDLDLTIYSPDSGPYAADDLLGYGAASTACPESATLAVADIEEGTVYDVWVIFWAGVDFGDLSNDMTVYIDVEREGSAITGTITMEGFTSTDSGVGYIPLTIERTGDLVTIKDAVSGDTILEGGAHLDFGDRESLSKMENIPLK